MSNEAFDQSRVPNFLAGTIILTVFATLFIGLRFFARRFSVAPFWWDDWMLIPAIICDFGLSACYWAQVDKAGLGVGDFGASIAISGVYTSMRSRLHGFTLAICPMPHPTGISVNRHTGEYGGPVTPDQLEEYFKILLALQICYFSTSVSTKTSLILMYYRIFGVSKPFRWALAVAWCIVLLYYVVNVLVAIFECSPVSYYWTQGMNPGTGTCIDTTQFYRWNGVGNLLIDFMILTLTIPMVWRLNLHYRQKVSLTGIFMLGTFVCIASIIRVTSFSEIINDDITFTIVYPSLWSVIEQSIGIICACLPTLRPLFGRIFPTSQVNTSQKKLKLSSSGPSFGLPKLSFRSGKEGSGEDSMTGFAKFGNDEENGFGSTVTTHVAGAVGNRNTVVPEGAVLRDDSIEQRVENSHEDFQTRNAEILR